MIELRIDGEPRGKGRPRFGKGARVYTDSKTVLAEGRIRGAWLEAGQPRLPDTAAVSVTVIVALERPRGHWLASGDLNAAGRRSQAPTKKPDADNVLKLVLDALNRLAYRDDSQVVDARVVKYWCAPGETEHTLIRLAEWGTVRTLRAWEEAA